MKKSCIIILTLFILTTGCVESINAQRSINSESDAQNIATVVSGATLNIIRSLGENSFNNKVIYGSSGKATINGKLTSRVDKYSSANVYTKNDDITIEFDNYASEYTDGATLNGIIKYTNLDRSAGAVTTGGHSRLLNGSSIKISNYHISDTINFYFYDHDYEYSGWMFCKGNGVSYDNIYVSLMR